MAFNILEQGISLTPTRIHRIAEEIASLARVGAGAVEHIIVTRAMESELAAKPAVRPLLCRLGFHRWIVTAQIEGSEWHEEIILSRCARCGSTRSRTVSEWDQMGGL